LAGVVSHDLLFLALEGEGPFLFLCDCHWWRIHSHYRHTVSDYPDTAMISVMTKSWPPEELDTQVPDKQGVSNTIFLRH
jgi:hypothetical protein